MEGVGECRGHFLLFSATVQPVSRLFRVEVNRADLFDLNADPKRSGLFVTTVCKVCWSVK
jgi:hypothetical protein